MSTERAQIAAACQRLAAAGLFIGTAGNVSVRVADRVAVTATGTALGLLTADEVTVVDLDGAVLAGRLAPTSELQLHLGIYRSLEARAVVHTHAPRAIALGLVRDELPVIHYQQLPLGGATPVVPFHPFGTAELAGAVRDSLDGRQAALLANHGAVTVGETLELAVEHALLLEWACGIYLDAASAGNPRPLSAAQQQAVADVSARLAYGTPKPIR
ncbi:class II aldolase/adducin family protein [Nocardia sp. CDC159]|uniref:Class II aldolase/adducin family protein n=1 Tax=Nocardia pulmonis TaxID=2951408 RepID=A0A9X2ECV4_9NOCA|nr:MULTISPECIES: class II aldolase/adducin family protein [Nocardia]MCM6778129.1 class II aldolase/adducin family protein [Nocardia pulmonis]MCM6791018.1 class II aldolase/adducin family protein [Nocardia sp. CDC159]